MRTYDLICIGCGPAGEKAATQAAYFNRRVAIIEKEPVPGGAMVNTGTIPTKALRETALLCSAFRRRPLPGTEFSMDRNVSIAKFMARRHLIEQQEHDRIEKSIDRHGIDVFRGKGRLEDRHTVLVERTDGGVERIRGDFILVSTGSSPVQPDTIPFDHPGVVDADGVLRLERMPTSMVIVGGGVIGCEYASIFAEMGVEVTLIHPRDAVLPFVDAECREHLVQAMTENGVRFVLDTSVEGAVGLPDGRVSVNIAPGEPIEAEVLLWAAGRSANTKGLGLETVGVEMNQRGYVLVDKQYRTAIPSIFAAGDVIGFPALAATSMEQGRIAVCSMFGLDFKKSLADVVPIGLYTIPAVSMVGLSEVDAEKQERDIVVGLAKYKYNVRARMLGDQSGIMKCIFDRHTRELLGATIVGTQATELIHLAQMAIVHNDTVHDFIDACYNYPSLTELFKYAAYSALQNIAAADEAEGTPDTTRRVA